MSELKALIFDCDGTLAETEEAHREAFNIAFKEQGLSWHWGRPMYSKLLEITGGRERLRYYVEQFHTEKAGYFTAGDFIPKLHARKTEIYGELAASGSIKLRPGVERLLDEAREKDIRLAIATTTNLKPLTALFEGTLGRDALGWFDAVAAGDMVKAKKPAPDLFLMALKTLELPPENCLALEDSRNGIKSARGAGLVTVVTKSAYTEDQEFPEAAAVISDFGEPHKFFKPLGGAAAEPGYADIDTLREWHAFGLAQAPEAVAAQ